MVVIVPFSSTSHGLLTLHGSPPSNPVLLTPMISPLATEITGDPDVPPKVTHSAV